MPVPSKLGLLPFGVLTLAIAAGNAYAEDTVNYAEMDCAPLAESLVNGFRRQGHSGLSLGQVVGLRWSVLRHVLPRRGRPLLYPCDYRSLTKGGVLIGQVRFAVVVHPSNPISSVSMIQLKALLQRSENPPDWKDFGARGGEVKVVADLKDPLLKSSLSRLCLHYIRTEGKAMISSYRAFGQADRLN